MCVCVCVQEQPDRDGRGGATGTGCAGTPKGGREDPRTRRLPAVQGDRGPAQTLHPP